MPYAIELFFDQSAEARVASLWQDMAAAGVPTLSREHGHRPHVSIGVAREVDAPALAAALARLASSAGQLVLSLASVGLFPTGEGVVYLAPVVSEALLWLHARFHTRILDHVTGANPYYAPGSWVPHCTVAYRVPRSQIARAAQIALAAPLPLRAIAVEVGLLRVSPAGAEQLACFPLRQEAGGRRQKA